MSEEEKDKEKNDSEKEENSSNEEDFGLPEFDFEALDDDSNENDADFSKKQEEESVSEESETTEFKQDSENDLYYEEESFDDFDQDSNDNVEADPERDLSEEEKSFVQENTQDIDDYAHQYENDADPSGYAGVSDDKPKGNFAKIVFLGLILFISIGGGFYYWFSQDKADKKAVAAKEKSIQKTKKPTPKKVVKKEPAKTIDKTQPSVVQPVSNPQVSIISKRQGKYHIIVGSYEVRYKADLHASNLVKKGFNTGIIIPYEQCFYFRIALAAYANLEDARANLDAYRKQYGQDVWVLKY